MYSRILLLTSALLLLAFAPPFGTPALRHGSGGQPVEGLAVSVVQHVAHAQLVIGSFDVPPTVLQITLPSGWSGAPTTVAISGTQLLTFELVRGSGAPQLGVVVVRGGGMQGHAYLAGAVVASAPPRRAGRVLLAMVRR